VVLLYLLKWNVNLQITFIDTIIRGWIIVIIYISNIIFIFTFTFTFIFIVGISPSSLQKVVAKVKVVSDSLLVLVVVFGVEVVVVLEGLPGQDPCQNALNEYVQNVSAVNLKYFGQLHSLIVVAGILFDYVDFGSDPRVDLEHHELHE